MTQRNGTGPAGSLREAKGLLERPFMPAAAEFVVVSAKEDNQNATIATYLSRTSVEDRLDYAVGPENWQAEYVPHPECVECRLTVFETTKASFGQGSDRWAQEANAFKRAARCFGVGRYLYKRKLTYKPIGNGPNEVHIRGRSSFVPAKLEAELREEYRRYLSEVAIPAYGDPIDHQDASGAVGDGGDRGVTGPEVGEGPQGAASRNGGGRPVAVAPQGTGGPPAHPEVRGRLRGRLQLGVHDERRDRAHAVEAVADARIEAVAEGVDVVGRDGEAGGHRMPAVLGEEIAARRERLVRAVVHLGH